jgi:hypothetical protein
MTAMEDPTLLRLSVSRREPRMVVSGRADDCQRADPYAVGNGRRDPGVFLKPQSTAGPGGVCRAQSASRLHLNLVPRSPPAVPKMSILWRLSGAASGTSGEPPRRRISLTALLASDSQRAALG